MSDRDTVTATNLVEVTPTRDGWLSTLWASLAGRQASVTGSTRSKKTPLNTRQPALSDLTIAWSTGRQ